MIHLEKPPLLSALLLVIPAAGFAGAKQNPAMNISSRPRAMQDDDFENPGMLTVEQGQHLFNNNRRPGKVLR